MKVLFAVWELDPFIKVGGLGDVAASLPRALKKLGVDIRIVIPYYKSLKLGRSKKKLLEKFYVAYDKKKEKVEVFEVTHPTSLVPVYLLKNKKYLETPDFPGTFAFFDKAAVSMGWKPDIIHCNDVHTGLIPLLVKQEKLPIKTILTIHNLTYQGKTSLEILTKIGLKPGQCQITPWEIESRQINFLLEGIIHADLITTVSPTYAKEIMTEEYGAGLEEVLRSKETRVFGVLNGIDNPKRLSPDSWQEKKRLSKRSLQKKLGLKVDASLPLLAFIGRFDPQQKGIDILHKMLRTMDLKGYEFVILGEGNTQWEERFQWLDTFYHKNISYRFVFDNLLAQKIYNASDFILVPSKFEPCGLIQMMAMGFGTLPIAHATGGLLDSIKNNTNGFLFKNYSARALQDTVEKAVKIWRNDQKQYQKMAQNALAADFSWDKSAQEYLRLYEQVFTEPPLSS